MEEMHVSAFLTVSLCVCVCGFVSFICVHDVRAFLDSHFQIFSMWMLDVVQFS